LCAGATGTAGTGSDAKVAAGAEANGAAFAFGTGDGDRRTVGAASAGFGGSVDETAARRGFGAGATGSTVCAVCCGAAEAGLASLRCARVRPGTAAGCSDARVTVPFRLKF
jgi:hypothetical protein